MHCGRLVVLPPLFKNYPMTPEERYNEIKNPKNFVKVFKDDAEFLEWCRLGTLEDLYCTLEAFKIAKQYWHCLLISDVIREKEKGMIYVHYYEPMVLIFGRAFFGVGEELDFGDGLIIRLNYN